MNTYKYTYTYLSANKLLLKIIQCQEAFANRLQENKNP